MSETAKFVKGTIVRLNSGGPKMTAYLTPRQIKFCANGLTGMGKCIRLNLIRRLCQNLKKLGEGPSGLLGLPKAV